jgi:hypothetical protein
MNPLKRLGIALFRTLLDQGDLIATQVLLPPVSGAIQARVLRAVTGFSTPPQGSARLATKRGLVTVTVDGGAVDGAVPGAWAKYAIPKGLPEEEGERRMAIENVPHRVDDFDGVIAEGYGKGLKKLVYSGTVAVKIDGETALRKINIHRHEADRAGMHYDLVCEGVPMGTERWELSIPNGPFKGRYAFVDASGALSSGEYNEGRLVTRMRDRGVRLDKPDYRLKDRGWLETEVRLDPDRYSVERKYDGALVNVAVRDARMYLRSHREGGETYYDRFPRLEHLENASPLLSCRLAFPAPDISAVFRAELVHPDGAARVGGLSNSMPEKAQEYQREHGDAELYAWDVAEYQGKNVSALPYHERRGICRQLVDELKPYCKNIHLAEAAPDGMDAVEFYEKIIHDPRGLPYSEGVVVKDLNDPSGRVFFKTKPRDDFDWPIAPSGIVEGAGKYAGSAGAITVEHPETGARSELGSLAVPDAERQWIWDHRTALEGHAVAKFEAMEITDAGAVRAGVFNGLHHAKGCEDALQVIAKHELAVAR